MALSLPFTLLCFQWCPSQDISAHHCIDAAREQHCPDKECAHAQVVLLSSPIPGQPLINSSNPSVDDDFVKEMTGILSGADAAHRQSRVERALPYELRAVEVGLATAVRAWEMEAIVLEHRTKPTLRSLLHKVRSPGRSALDCKLAGSAHASAFGFKWLRVAQVLEWALPSC